ncbi:MAG: hypothetical protein KAT54_03210, partial [Candidatus Marinimicrobia bacterium]|nr:hypothetical protein [Candidatus Neomarinimicrobiota bacterium]
VCAKRYVYVSDDNRDGNSGQKHAAFKITNSRPGIPGQLLYWNKCNQLIDLFWSGGRVFR